MISLSDIRKEAREKLEGNWGDAVVFTLVYLVIAAVVSSAIQYGGILMVNEAFGSAGSLIGTILILPMGFAFSVGFLGLYRGMKLSVSDLFGQYNKRVFFTELLKFVYIALWSLLLIVPGIIKTYSYAMTEFLMMDNPELEKNAAIEESMRMMQGHKMRLFLLDLSFIGWMILCVLTFGLGALLLEPYMETARAVFYEELKNGNA